MSVTTVLQDMENLIGKEIFVSDWTEMTQEQINKFADSTKDHQWIHVDAERAAQGPFGKTIAHGFLTLSLLGFFSYQVPLKFAGAKMLLNYGLDKVRFINPVLTGAKIRDRIVLSSLEEKPEQRILMTQVHTIEIEGQEKPACVAQFLIMIYF